MSSTDEALARLRDLVISGRSRLRFPGPLEKQWSQDHRRDILLYYQRVGLPVALLTLALVVLGMATEPLDSLLTVVRDPLGFHQGMPLVVVALLACMFGLPLASHLRALDRFQEVWFLVLGSTALGAAVLCLLMAQTVWMQYLWVLGVAYGYIILYGLSRHSLVLKVVSSALAIALALGCALLLGLTIQWKLLVVLGFGMNLLGIMLGYMDETRERAHYLQEQLMSLEQQRLHELSEQVARQNRLKERVNAMHDVMSGEDDPWRLAERILRHLVPEVRALVGVLYFREGERLVRLASSGLDDDHASHPEELAPGETLVGQCLVEGRPIHLDRAPAHYLPIRSGVGECSRPAIAMIPLTHNDRVCGVVELAGFQPMEDDDRQFLAAVSPSLAIALTSVTARHRARADA